jgi:hypothetical protein
MAFRLMNSGRRLVWETEEYLYHTWHPGSDGIDNYLGPHDGKNFSTTALQALCSGRVRPLIENEAIRRLRTGDESSGPELREVLIDPDYLKAFDRTKLGEAAVSVAAPNRSRPVFTSYHGFDIYRLQGMFYAVIQNSALPDLENPQWHEDERLVKGQTFADICEAIEAFEPRLLEEVDACNICQVGKRFAVVPHALGAVNFHVRSQRENPRIVWLASLAEARQIAKRLSGPAPGSVVLQTDVTPPLKQPAPPDTSRGLGVTPLSGEVAKLERRIAAMEASVSDIYSSRTWRALTRVGGLLQGASPRPRRNGSS